LNSERRLFLEQPAEAFLPRTLRSGLLALSVGLLIADLSFQDLLGLVYRVARAVASPEAM